jgi:ABC-2 type transport system permease protein
MLCLLLGQLGPLFGLPQWLLAASPFSHTPKLPGGTVSAAPLVALSTAAIALVYGGLAAFRHRDVG